jgi:hypothetical protein
MLTPEQHEQRMTVAGRAMLDLLERHHEADWDGWHRVLDAVPPECRDDLVLRFTQAFHREMVDHIAAIGASPDVLFPEWIAANRQQ